jgi:hypothetical protein
MFQTNFPPMNGVSVAPSPSSGGSTPQSSAFTMPASSGSASSQALHPTTPLGLGLWLTIGSVVALVILRRSLPN